MGRGQGFVAELVVAAVEGERTGLGPYADDQVVGLVVAVAELARVLAVREARVHRRADREARDEPTSREAVEHRELLGDTERRVVERERVPHHDERRIAGPSRERGGHQVGRRHEAVPVRVVLVHADAVEADFGGELELVQELVVHPMSLDGIEEPGVDVDPHRRMPRLEVVGQVRVRHQVEPAELHDDPSTS
jgi:hypothetical protein